MRWLKREIWKAGVAVVGLLPLILMVWVPVSAVGVHERSSGLAILGASTVQVTPTEDATVTALNKEKLAQEVQQLENQNDRSITTWLWNSGAALGTIGAALVAVFGVLATITFNAQKERKDRRDARKKQAEERFKSVVEGLGGASADTKLASAVLLRTFLGPDYKEFYVQVFDLAVANLRPQKHTDSSTTKSSGPSKQVLTTLLNVINRQLPKSTPTEESTSQSSIDIVESPDPLTQARITAFMEAFPLAREELIKQKSRFVPQFLDATSIQLDNAFLYGADLRLAWMPRASLGKANLKAAMLEKINLREAHLTCASLDEAILSYATLTKADLTKARLQAAVLTGAILKGAILTNATLNGADLNQADLSRTVGDDKPRPAILSDAQLMEAKLIEARLDGADLTRANLTNAQLVGATLTGATLDGADLTGADFSGANLEDAQSLKGTNLREVKGLTREQLEACKVKGAIIENTDPLSLLIRRLEKPIEIKANHNVQKP